jgi:fructose-bisphosphate aldolase class II
MTLAGGKAVKEALDKIEEGKNVFYHDIPLIATEAMKDDVVNAIKIFSLEV